MTDAVLGEYGFATPESALHDPDADVYLISNIAGDPFAKDDNGFISRLAPDGKRLAMRWIDGRKDDVTLHAPKGLALLGEELWVADIDEVRRSPFEPNGGPPSLSMNRGSPNAANVSSRRRRTSSHFGETIAWHVSDARLNTSLTVSGSQRVPSPTRNQPL